MTKVEIVKGLVGHLVKPKTKPRPPPIDIYEEAMGRDDTYVAGSKPKLPPTAQARPIPKRPLWRADV